MSIFQVRHLPFLFFVALSCFVISPAQAGAAEKQDTVIIYTAMDQFISEPVLKDFETQTGIRVKAVYDVEATKTTGLVNRLIAEKDRPKCDVFWNNEVLKSIMLKQKGVFQPYASANAADIPDKFKDKQAFWTGFAARARVLVINTQAAQGPLLPASIKELTDPRFKGKATIANPLFGTTATHVAALFSVWGEEQARNYFLALKSNGVRIVDGNSVVKDRVGAGEFVVGFTDTDDVNVGLGAGLPIRAVYPDKLGMGTLLIPNTVGLMAGCPHPEAGKKLIDYLLSKAVESKLAFCPSVQMPLRKDVAVPENFVAIDQIAPMDVDYEQVARMMEPSMRFVQETFIR
jgi:iron(III) transport system substrate-binding protein